MLKRRDLKKLNIIRLSLCLSLVLILTRSLSTQAGIQREPALCNRKPEKVKGVIDGALNFRTSQTSIFHNTVAVIFDNGPKPFLYGESGTISLWFKAEYFSKGLSVLLELGGNKRGLSNDCDGIIPACADLRGDGLMIGIRGEKPSGTGKILTSGKIGGRSFYAASPNTIDLTKWHNVCVVWNKGIIKLYVDGDMVGKSKRAPEDDFALCRFFQLAGDMYYGNGFKGALDDIAVFNQALSDQEIKQLAERKITARSLNPSFYMPCDNDKAVAEIKRVDLDEAMKGRIIFRAYMKKGRFQPSGDALNMRLSIPNSATGTLRYSLAIDSFDGKNVFHREGSIRAGENQNLSATLTRCGIYSLKMNVKDARDKIVFSRHAKFGVIAAMPKLSEVPDSSPCGADHMPYMDLGDKWYRTWGTVLSRSSLQPRKDTCYWDYLDHVVKRTRDAGGDIVLCLYGTPDWNSSITPETLKNWPKTDQDGFRIPPGMKMGECRAPDRYPPADLKAYEAFLRELCRRYKGKIKAYQCWNEPDTVSHFAGTPQQYLDMLKVVYRVVKEEDPDAIVVGGVGSGFLRWSNIMFSLDAGKYMDVLDVHTYTYSDPVKEYRSEHLGQFIAALREYEKKLGRRLPVWATELGTTYKDLSKDAFLKEYGKEITIPKGITVTYREQSINWDIQTALNILSIGGDCKYFWGGTNVPRLNHKSVAFAALAKVVSFRTDARQVALSDQAAAVILSYPDGKHNAAVFGHGAVVIPIQAKQVNALDVYGNPMTFDIKDNLLELDLNGETIYLMDIPGDLRGVPVASLRVPDKTEPGKTLTGTFSVTNPYANKRAFTLKSELPNDWRLTLSERELSLNPGETKTVTVQLTSSDKRGKEPIRLLACDDQGRTFTAEQSVLNLSILNMPRVPLAPELPSEPQMSSAELLATVDTAERVDIGYPDPEFPDDPHWMGPEDLSFRVYGGWREDAIYLWIDVTDDKLYPAESLSRPWMKDSIDILVGFLFGKKITGTMKGTEQVIVIPALTREFSPCKVRLINKGKFANAEFYGKKTAKGYMVCGKIYHDKLASGARVGLDVKINDCDNPSVARTRKTSMAWIGDENNCKSSFLWGHFNLQLGVDPAARVMLWGDVPIKPLSAPQSGFSRNPKWARDKDKTISSRGKALTNKGWEDFEFSFIPLDDGTMKLVLMGRCLREKDSTVNIPVWVCWDNVQLDGADIVNGDFERKNDQGDIIGWEMKKENIIQEDGNTYIKSWHNAGVSQSINAKKGRKVTIKAKVKRLD